MNTPESPRPAVKHFFVQVPENHLSHEPVDAVRVTKLSELGVIGLAQAGDHTDRFADRFVATDSINYVDAPASGVELIVIPPSVDDQTHIHYIRQIQGRAEMYRVQLGLSSAQVESHSRVPDGELHMAKDSVVIGVKKVMPRGILLPGRDENLYGDALNRTRAAIESFKSENARSWGRKALRRK